MAKRSLKPIKPVELHTMKIQPSTARLKIRLIASLSILAYSLFTTVAAHAGHFKLVSTFWVDYDSS